MSETTTTIPAPLTRIHGNLRSVGDPLYIRPAAKLALSLAVAVLRSGENVPGDPWTAADQAGLDRLRAKVAADPSAGRLAAVAEHLGQTLDPNESSDFTRYTAAQQLIAEHNRIDTLPAQPDHGQDDETDTCRHGRTFNQTCDDCEA